MTSSNFDISLRLRLPARVQAASAELARRLGGHVPLADEQRAGSTLWAPFGFVPLVVDEHGARGLHLARGSGSERPEELPVAFWDAARGQLAPLAGSLDRYLAVVREGLRDDRPLSEEAAERSLELDPQAAPAAVALAGHLLEQGDLPGAEALLRRAADSADWWMAPCLLLTGLLRLRGRRAEAASWCAEALSRRWDATGAGRRVGVPRLGDDPRRILRAAVSYLRRNEEAVAGLSFDPAWRPVRDAADPLSPAAHAAAARQLARTGRLGAAAARWEWLALGHGVAGAAGQAERAYETLSWPLHRRHSRLLRLGGRR